MHNLIDAKSDTMHMQIHKQQVSCSQHVEMQAEVYMHEDIRMETLAYVKTDQKCQHKPDQDLLHSWCTLAATLQSSMHCLHQLY